MAKMEMTEEVRETAAAAAQDGGKGGKDGKKLRTRDLIYAGAFGAIYLVVMLIIVMGTSAVPILYLIAPLTVGIVCGTIYEMCVIKVHKFGAALILGVLFALIACGTNVAGIIVAIVAALVAELVIKAGNYKSKKMYLASFVPFNITMACPYLMLVFAYDEFMTRAAQYYGQAHADGLMAVMPSGSIWFVILALAIAGGILGALVASKLIKKHFAAAGIV